MPTPKRRPVHLIVTLIVGLPLAVILVWPQAFGAQRTAVVAQLVAFRAPLAVALGVLAIVCAVVAVLRWRWAIAAGIAVVLGIAALGNGAVLLARAGGGATVFKGGVTVAAWNTQGGAASPSSIAELVLATDADIVALPETDESASAEVVRLLGSEGRMMIAATTRGQDGDSPIPTSVLIDVDLGEYRLDLSAGSTPGLPSGVWRPVDGSGPTIVAAHPEPPLPGVMDQWRSGLSWIAERCEDPDVIVAGDLNATVDHLYGLGDGPGLIGECDDAASQSGAAAAGTWPATQPTWLASPIDHVLVGSGWAVRRVRVLTSFDDAGSDHRPLVAVLDERS